MHMTQANGIALHWREDGDPHGQPVVFANSLGTDLRLWDALLDHLPQSGFRYIRYDKRGHGLSDCPPPPYAIRDLSGDVGALIDTLGLGPVIFVGLSIGGMIGQDLAATRPDLVRALVLSNTAAKMGTPEMWRQRIEAITQEGVGALAPAILDRWFAPRFRNTPEAGAWQHMLARTPKAGYLGCCAAIAEADLTTQTATLTLPSLAIVGDHDGASPPETVAATAALISGTPCHVIADTGHLPCAEDPAAYAAILTPFLEENAR